MRLRNLVRINPSKSEVSCLPPTTEVTFAPMEAIADGLGGLDTSLSRTIEEVGSGSYSYFADGDILLAKVTPCFENGKKALAKGLRNGNGFATSEVHVIRPGKEKIDPVFLTYLLSSQEFRAAGMASMTGAGGLRRVSESAILDFRISITDISTQQTIAAFLDRETARIDQLIAKKERMIRRLAEKRAVVVSLRVTGLVANGSELVETNSPFLPRVPRHWQLSKLKHGILRIEQGWSPECEARLAEDGEWGVLKVGCVNFGQFRDSEHKALPNQLAPRPSLEIRVGDLLMSRANTSELVGSVALVKQVRTNLMLCDKLYRIVVDEGKLNAKFLHFVLNDRYVRRQIESECSGASQSMQNLSQAFVKELEVAIPSIDEQIQIATRCQQISDGIATLLMAIERSIDRLRELRSALITAAVTGQIDVATWGERGETDRRLEKIEHELAAEQTGG